MWQSVGSRNQLELFLSLGELRAHGESGRDDKSSTGAGALDDDAVLASDPLGPAMGVQGVDNLVSYKFELSNCSCGLLVVGCPGLGELRRDDGGNGGEGGRLS